MSHEITQALNIAVEGSFPSCSCGLSRSRLLPSKGNLVVRLQVLQMENLTPKE